MDPEAVAALIPVAGILGFFAWLIVRTVTKASTARLEAQRHPTADVGARQEEVLAAVEELRREVAELAERVDFTERLLAKETPQREGRKA